MEDDLLFKGTLSLDKNFWYIEDHGPRTPPVKVKNSNFHPFPSKKAEEAQILVILSIQ